MSFLYDRTVDLVRRMYDSRLSDPPILDCSTRFPDGQRFAEAWPRIRDEALAIAETIAEVPRFHEVMAEQADISANDNRDWRMFVLKAYGVPVARNIIRCPVLAGLLASTPDVLSASLSFLAPHKVVPQHRGPFRGILRFYMGLSVPTNGDGLPATVLTIDGADYRLGDGDSLLWDDTYPHAVWNNSDSVRIALLLDVRRRGMPADLALLSRALIAATGTLARFRKLA